MEIGELFYAASRAEWRAWLEKNYAVASEIWLVGYKKHTGKPTVAYNDAVEEALCFGWIDSTAKRVDDERSAQRYTPRRSNSELSEMNRERVRRLLAAGLMTDAGLAAISRHLSTSADGKPIIKEFIMPDDIIDSLKADPLVWQHFCSFPLYYRHIRVAFVEGARSRPEEFRKRLDYLIRMTRQNKQFGMLR